ncbi:signal peptidase I [Natronococcus wangiae]|uniref:signal peptidase I n=1 Tax=Natronococcus wangiae TaxID=3068275 RepID=UPI00273EE2C2|nr:signal peptidase I [Natronococcus sp. AD5]
MRQLRPLQGICYGIILCLIAASLLGVALGQPILVSYVYSDSMEPTIEEGDGFIVAPSALAGSPESGDIVIFEAEQIGDGGLTTHRIVEKTENGYVTRGDANVVTDQAGGEPHVDEDKIVAQAFTIGDDPVTIPHLGTTIEATKGTMAETPFDGTAIPLLLLGLLIMGASWALDRGRVPAAKRERTPSRSSYSVRGILIIAVVIFLLAATLAMVIPSGTTQYTVLATEMSDSDDPLVVELGDPAAMSHEIDNNGITPVIVVHDPVEDGVTVDERTSLLGPFSSDEVTMQIDTPSEEGSIDRTVGERRYVALLPPSLVVALHDIHPWLAIIVLNGMICLMVAVVKIGTPLDYVRIREGSCLTRHIKKITRRTIWFSERK